MTTKITVCVVMGLPAVGKTTLVQKLQSQLKENGVHCCVFSYDELTPEKIDFDSELQEKDLTSLSTNNLGKWKMYRKLVFDLIESCVMYLRIKEYSKTLDTFSNGCQCFYDEKLSTESSWHVVLVDDNMFYRSMRYTFYQLSRNYQCSFCQIFLSNDDLEELIRRSDNRSNEIVTESTIRKMARLYEAPDLQKFYWEKHTMKLDCQQHIDHDKIKTIYSFILDISQEIVPPLESERDKEEKERCKKEIMESYLHQCDQILRKFISTKMEIEKKSSTNKKTLSQMGSYLNTKRKNYLQMVKKAKSDVVVDCLCSEDWKEKELQQFQNYLQQEKRT